MKLFKNKASKKEYTRDMLPHNRKEVFFDVLKLQWKSLLGLGGIVMLAFLPLIFCYAVENVSASIMLDNSSAAAGTPEYAAVLNQINMLSNIMAFVKIPFFALLSVALAGVARVIRQHAYEECVSFTYDFPEGVKQNAKSAVILALLTSLVGAVSYFAYGLRTVADGIFRYICAFPIALYFVVFIPIAAVVAVLIPVYSNSFSRNMKWAVYIFAKKPLRIIISLVLSMSVFALSLVPGFIVGLVGLAVGAMLIPVAMLGFYLSVFDVLDEYINKDNFPEIVGKGTF